MSINLSLHGIVLETFRARKNHEQGKLQMYQSKEQNMTMVRDQKNHQRTEGTKKSASLQDMMMGCHWSEQFLPPLLHLHPRFMLLDRV